MSSKTNKTLAVTGIQELTLVEENLEPLNEGEVRIRVGYVGICGSDIPRYFDGAVHSFPQVLGHEFSGVIEEIGPDTEIRGGLAVGYNVVVAPLVPCHECERCKAGNPSLCPNYSFIGSRQQGAMADYVVVPAVNVLSSEDLPLDIAALVEPLTVALHGISMAEIDPKKPALVLGCGVIGLMTVISLKACGVQKIIVADLKDKALETATEFGATQTINSRDQDLLETLDPSNLPGLVVETACAPITRTQALYAAAKKATVVLIGTPTRDWTLSIKDYEQILRRELTLNGSWMSYSNPFPGEEWHEAVRILSGLKDTARKLISHTFDLSEVASGFDVIKDPEIENLKIMFKVAPDGVEQP